MVPTSATKKKPSASTKRKVAAKKKSSAKAKPKVTKATKTTALVVSRKRKKPAAKEEAPIPVLPSDWPVASQPPTFPPEASALRPGSLLQQTCSGNDIQLVRSACAVPNFDKQKGKFLLIFPGNFSFGKLAENASSEPKSGNADSDEKPALVKQEDDTTAMAADEVTSKNPSAAAATTTTTMGRIEGLKTNNPTFRIPFPHLQKSLVFPGKKVATTSKFLALSCSNKKSGTVQCKNIFSSAVVFGMPNWESSADNGTVVSTPISAATSAKVSPNVKQESSEGTAIGRAESGHDEDEDDNDTKIRVSFLHYGGSERTVDGATRSSRKSVSNKSPTNAEKVAATPAKKVPIFSSHANNHDGTSKPASAFDFSNNSNSKPQAKPGATPKTPKSYDTSSSDEEVLQLSSDDSDGDYDDKEVKSSKDALIRSATKTRLPPRRQASMTKKKYVDEDEEEEEEESSDDESDKSEIEDEAPSKKNNRKKAPAAAKVPSRKNKAQTPTKGFSKKRTPPKKQNATTTAAKSSSTKKKSVPTKEKEVIELDEDASSPYASETSLHEKETLSGSKRSSSRRKSTSQKKAMYKEVDESEFEDSSDDDSEKENASHASSSDRDAPKTAKKGKPAPRRKATPRSKLAVAVKKTPSSKHKAAPSRIKSATTVTPKSSSGTKRRRTATSEKKDVSVLESSSTTPSPGAKSPFRRRHKKKSSPAKKSRTVLDLTQDDEFTFG